jgi:molybdenum cofactor cytidylyltransferase
MGTCKAMLPWGEKQTLLTYQFEQFRMAGVGTIAVLNPRNAALMANSINSIRAIVNPSPELGKTHSILLGLSQLPPNFATVIISAVDQPRPAQLYQDLINRSQQQANPIVVPTCQGKIGHPILFSRQLFPELLTISEATLGLRQVIQKYRSSISYLEATEIVLTDLNTPDAYTKLLKKL